MDSLKKFLKKHYKLIIAPVIAGLLLWSIKSFVSADIFKKIIGILTTRYDLPFYILLLLFIAGLVCPFLFKITLFLKRNWMSDYYRDEVNGLVWDNVQVRTGESPPANLTPLCPICWADLPTSDSTNKYECVSCGFMKEYNYFHRDVLTLVKIEINKRIRTGDWKEAKKRIREIKSKS